MVVSAPSGGGKTTMCHRLIDRVSGVEFSVSHTTRALRGNERDGVDYFFVDDRTFDRMIAEDAFLEWAHVHGQRYGTSRAEADKRLPRGLDVLFDIDVQGGRQIKAKIPDAALVFVVPPSMEVLEARLRGRHSDSEEQIQGRLRAAEKEIAQAGFYDYWIVNDKLEDAVDELWAVLTAERLKRKDRTSWQK